MAKAKKGSRRRRSARKTIPRIQMKKAVAGLVTEMASGQIQNVIPDTGVLSALKGSPYAVGAIVAGIVLRDAGIFSFGVGEAAGVVFGGGIGLFG